MFRKILTATAFIVFTMAASACSNIGSFDRSVLTMPPAPIVAAPNAAAPALVIRSVSDERVFEAAPRNPSTPSLGPDGGGASVQARAIGRKRDGYGRAHGDVLLQPGETVEGLVRAHVVAALQQGGVRVIDESAASPDIPRVDVHIDQFWAWLHPSMFIHQNVQINIRFEVAGAAAVTATGRYDGDGPLPPDRVWVAMFESALASFRTDLSARARQAPFVPTSAPTS